MKNPSKNSKPAILLTLIMLIAFIGHHPAHAADKLRVGVAGIAYKGGNNAKKMADDVQKDIVKYLGKDERIAVAELESRQLEKNKTRILKNGKAVPADILKNNDLIVIAGVWIEGQIRTVKIEFIKGGSGEIIKQVTVHEKKDTPITVDVEKALATQIDAIITTLAEKTPPTPAEQKVRARGVGISPVNAQQNALMAERGATVLAQRDAAERGIGAVIDLNAIPYAESRKIVATVQAQLINVTVVSSGLQGDAFVVEIEADVILPPDIAKQYPPTLPPESTGMKPAIQVFKKGSVNWETGVIVARGIGKAKGADAQSVEMAKRAARVDSYAVAMEIINGISFDTEKNIQEVVAGAPMKAYRIRALVQGANVTETKQLDAGTWQVSIEVPTRGLKGVELAFSDVFNLQPAPPPLLPDEPEPSPDEEQTTGLVIDARQTGLLPAMCPVVVDEDGTVIYGAGGIPGDIIMQRGVAAYTTGEPAGPKGARLGPHPLRIQAARVEYAPLQVASAGQAFPLFSLLRPGILIAQAVQKVVLRQGSKALNVSATSSTGPKKAKVVVTKSTAAQIKRTNKKSNYLGEARVVIITDSMVGATEGRRPMPPSRILSSAR